MNSSSGPVRHHERSREQCSVKGCRRKVVFEKSKRCGPHEDAAARRPFAVLDSYLEEMKR